MKLQPRIYYTETDKTLKWDRWQKGESQSSIARHFGRGHSSVQLHCSVRLGYVQRRRDVRARANIVRTLKSYREALRKHLLRHRLHAGSDRR